MFLNVPEIDSISSDKGRSYPIENEFKRKSRSIVKKESEIRLGSNVEDAVSSWLIVNTIDRGTSGARPFAYLAPLSIAVFVRGHVARIIVRGYK